MSQKFKNFSIQTLLQSWPDLIKPSEHFKESQSTTEIEQVCSLQDPQANSIVFISEGLSDFNFTNTSNLPKAVVVPLNTPQDVLTNLAELNIIPLLSPQPKLAMAFVSEKFFTGARIDNHFAFSESHIHPSATIHPSAQLGEGVKVGPNAVIGKDCVIGDFSKIASNVVIESEVTLGKHCQIYPNATLSWGSVLGDYCNVQSNSCVGSDGFGYATSHIGQHFGIPHLGRVRFGNHVHIGAGTQIDRGTYGETSIGDFTKIDNLVHIAHNCKIGKSCLLTAGFMMAGSSEVGNFFVTGGGTVVTGHIKVTDNVQVAGVSVVTKSITKSGKYGGYPLVSLSEHLKITATSGKILEIRKNVSRILKHLKLDQD